MSSTHKEDNEGVNIKIEDQLVNIPSQKPEGHHEEQEGETPIEVEESVSEKSHEKQTVLMVEDEVHIPPSAPVH